MALSFCGRYMHIYEYQLPYNALTAHTFEDSPASSWNEILHRYFPEDDFMILIVYPPDSIKTRADVTMHSLMGAGKTRLVVVAEDQDIPNETSNAAWGETVKQLADYMIQCREEDTNKREATGFLPYDMYDMYDIANVGRYSRLYVLKSDEHTLRNHPPTGGSKTLDFKDDELEIVATVKELVRKIIPYGFPSSSSPLSSSSSSSSAGSPRCASPTAAPGPD